MFATQPLPSQMTTRDSLDSSTLLAHAAAIIESSNDAIVAKNMCGEIISWNPAAERMFGYTSEEILGRSVSVLIPEARVNEERDILEKLLRGEAIRHYETERVRKDGTIFPVSLSISPIRNASGEIVGAAKIVRDITERKNSEALNRDIRFQALFETIIDGVIIINARGIIQSMNPAAVHLFGYTPDEMIGHNVSLLMPAPYARAHDSYLDNYLRTGERKIIGIGREAVARHKNGSTFPIDLAVTEMKVGQDYMFTGIVRDISLRKQIEARNALEQEMASELIERLLAPEQEGTKGLIIWRGESLLGKRDFSGDLILHANSCGYFYILHADSMGHGLAAAIPLLPLADIFYQLANSGHTVSAIATNLNRMMYERMPTGRFVSASILCIDSHHHNIEIWCGGMPPIVIFDREGKLVAQIEAEHPALGVMPPEAFSSVTKHWHWGMKLGERLFSYTDGLTDAQGNLGDVFGHERLMEMFSRHHVIGSDQSLPIGFFQPLLNFVDPALEQDDVSLLIVDCQSFENMIARMT